MDEAESITSECTWTALALVLAVFAVLLVLWVI